jgi:hypothetical protein
MYEQLADSFLGEKVWVTLQGMLISTTKLRDWVVYFLPAFISFPAGRMS